MLLECNIHLGFALFYSKQKTCGYHCIYIYISGLLSDYHYYNEIGSSMNIYSIRNSVFGDFRDAIAQIELFLITTEF